MNEEQDLEQLIREIPVFGQFPVELLAPLIIVSEIQEFRPNEQILNQGQMNDRLLFLITGEVSVFVDGGFVGKVQEKGALLGEMSVIKRQPCGATLVADTDVLIVAVDTEALLRSGEAFKSLYQSVLYCMYSHVLVEKLEKTNEKAKQFEETNARLKAAEADLRSLNENLEHQVLKKTKAIEGKLTKLHDEVLLPLKSSSALSKEDQSKVLEALEILGPLKDSLTNGLRLKDQKILYCDGAKKNHLVTKLALGGTGALLDQAFSFQELQEKMSQNEYALLVMDASFLEHLEDVQNMQPDCSCMVVLDGHIREHLEKFDQLPQNLRFLFRSEDKKTQIHNILSAVTKVLTHQIFGLEPYTGFGVEAQSERIKSSDQRAELLSHMETYLAESGVRSSFRDQARLVAEELLMNAIYDAPCDPIERKPLFNHLARTEAVTLDAPQQGSFSYLFDGTRIVVSVRDPFGSLEPQTIYKYLKNSYSERPQEINMLEGKGGAGRGLHQIVESSHELIFNLSPEKKTEVISIIYTDKAEGLEGASKIQLFVE